MSRHFPLVLVGNALSLMVGATRLGRNGIDVAIVNGTKNWGGHFTTVRSGGGSFDAGMVLQEFTSYNLREEDADPRTYDPAVRNDAGRFCHAVRRYLDMYQSSHDIPSPEMYVHGVIYDDILLANALSSLKRLPFAEQIERELLALLDRPSPSPLHASRKHRRGAFETLKYDAVSLANHGETFHAKLIEPFCRKVLNIPTSDVLALFHRVAWLPLFHPETLLSFLRGEPQSLPATIFSYPTGGCVGDLAKALEAEMDGNDRITILADRIASIEVLRNGKFTLVLESQEAITADRVAWANSLTELLRALGIEQDAPEYLKCSIALAFMRVPNEAVGLDFTVLSIVDPTLITYRITNQTRCAELDSRFAHLVVELSPDYARAAGMPSSKSELTDRVMQEMVALGVLKVPVDVECVDLKIMTNALTLPIDANRAAFAREMNAAFAAAPTLSLLGPASGFFSSSFNDQVVQGLKLAAQQEDL